MGAAAIPQAKQVVRWLPELLCGRLHVLARELRDLARHGVETGRIHHVRIASRRTRDALDLAQLLPDGHHRLRKFSRRLNRLAETFGPVRDIDVQLPLLQPDSDGGGNDPRLTPLRDRLRRRLLRWRARETRTLAARLPEAAALAVKLTQLERELRCDGLRHHSARKLEKQVGKAIRADLATFQKAAAAAKTDPQDATLHRWRIAVKKLRYRLEALDPLFHSQTSPPPPQPTTRNSQPVAGRAPQPVPSCLAPWIEGLVRLQVWLGQAHDLAVFQTALQRLATEETTAAAKRGGLRNPLPHMRLYVKKVFASEDARKHYLRRNALTLHREALAPRHWRPLLELWA